MKVDDGGPAFPVRNETERSCVGMSLRDWFAGKAPQQIPNQPGYETEHWEERTGIDCPSEEGSKYRDTNKGWAEFWFDVEATARYQFADAMIRARSSVRP